MLRWYFTNICGTLCEILELKSLRLLLSLSPFTNWKTYIELLFLIKQVQPLCFLFNFIIHTIDFQILSTLICLTLSWLALWKNKDTSVITSKTILEYIPLYLQIGDKKKCMSSKHYANLWDGPFMEIIQKKKNRLLKWIFIDSLRKTPL